MRALDELRRLVALLEEAEADTFCPGGECVEDECGCGGEAVPAKHRSAVLDVHRSLAGDPQDVPYSQRQIELYRLLPEIEGWCVVNVRRAGLHSPADKERRHIWSAHATLTAAERWRDFFEDFYYSTHIRDGKEAWIVEYGAAPAYEFRRDTKKTGEGFYDRTKWAGTLPMRRWQLQPGKGWTRKRATGQRIS